MGSLGLILSILVESFGVVVPPPKPPPIISFIGFEGLTLSILVESFGVVVFPPPKTPPKISFIGLFGCVEVESVLVGFPPKISPITSLRT